MGQKCPYSITRVKNIVTNLHIYGPREVLLLFCNNQDTKSESREMEIGVTGLILTKKISKYLWVNDIHNIEDGGKSFLQ